jgi:hypothetical protein
MYETVGESGQPYNLRLEKAFGIQDPGLDYSRAEPPTQIYP